MIVAVGVPDKLMVCAHQAGVPCARNAGGSNANNAETSKHANKGRRFGVMGCGDGLIVWSDDGSLSIE